MRVENANSNATLFDYQVCRHYWLPIRDSRITLYSYNLAYEELVNFNPVPADFGKVRLTVVDVADQHTLSLDASKMGAGAVVTARPFYDTAVSFGGTTFVGGGIRVDYPGEVYLYLERKNGETTNYYNLITLNGPAPVGTTVRVTDPFGVFAEEGVANPAPAGTKPSVLLVGGQNVNYSYTEAAGGSQANVLLAGGYGTSTLSGGTMMFGNFIPADRLAGAKGHLGDLSGFDAAGRALINVRIDDALAPADSSRVLGATMTGNRGGLMFGGTGANSLIAMGAGVYEMIDGRWLITFNISPSFGGAPATYRIDVGPSGQNSLVVRAPLDEHTIVENAATADKYDPQFRALAIRGLHGDPSVAHGVQTVTIIAGSIGLASPSVEFGDTSEVNADFSLQGAAHVKFTGTRAADAFNVTNTGSFYARKDHFTVRNNYQYRYENTYSFLYEFPFLDYFKATGHGGNEGDVVVPNKLHLPNAYIQHPDPQRWPDPVYAVARTFGTNGRKQSISFAVADPDASSITLDGNGGSNSYNLRLGVGSFLDVAIVDADPESKLAVTMNDPYLAYHRAALTDASLSIEYFTWPLSMGGHSWGPPAAATFSGAISYFTNSVYHHPTVTFGNNMNLALDFGAWFEQFDVDRPKSSSNVDILIWVVGADP